jgi:hypothetical protein
MAAEDQLTRMLQAWREDIESVPFPVFTVDSRPDTPVPAPRSGWERFSGLYHSIRSSGDAKARRMPS